MAWCFGVQGSTLGPLSSVRDADMVVSEGPVVQKAMDPDRGQRVTADHAACMSMRLNSQSDYRPTRQKPRQSSPDAGR